jgi:hypothetical protein
MDQHPCDQLSQSSPTSCICSTNYVIFEYNTCGLTPKWLWICITSIHVNIFFLFQKLLWGSLHFCPQVSVLQKQESLLTRCIIRSNRTTMGSLVLQCLGKTLRIMLYGKVCKPKCNTFMNFEPKDYTTWKIFKNKAYKYGNVSWLQVSPF